MDPRTSDLPGEPTSLWLATAPETGYPPLQGEVEVDVAVIGGGLAGIATATLLKEAGQRVAVIEARRVGHGVTGHTTAKLTALHGLAYAQLIARFGEAKARAYADANASGIRETRRLVEARGIDCDLATTTAYTYTEDPDEAQAFHDEAAAGATVGLPIELTDDAPLPYPVAAAVRLGEQARFHPLRFLLALAAQLPGDGSHVFEGSRVLEYRHGEPCRVTTSGGTVRARDVIVASHYPIGDKALYAFRMTPHRSYVLGVRPAAGLPEGLERAMLYGTKPHHSLRTHPTDAGPLLLVGGEGHVTGEGGNTAERYLRLEEWARRRFGALEVVYRWSAQDNRTLDGVPYIGRAAPGMRHLYVATGFGGWGMTHGLVAGLLLRDLIVERPNPWEALYEPRRVNLHGASDLVGMGVRATRHLLFDRLAGQRSWSVPPGQGVVVRDEEDGSVALYRAADGTLTRLSAACTHLGCIVGWNDAEKSWDCPCHGSRFEPGGAVIQGPAVRPLKKLG